MPTYEYACQACGHRFDAFQSLSAKVRRTCPACKRPRLERLISAGGGIIFKGSGFYITDYRGPGYQEAAKKDSEPPKATDGKAVSDNGTPASTGAGKDSAAKNGAAKDGAAGAAADRSTTGERANQHAPTPPSKTSRAGSATKSPSKRSAGRAR